MVRETKGAEALALKINQAYEAFLDYCAKVQVYKRIETSVKDDTENNPTQGNRGKYAIVEHKPSKNFSDQYVHIVSPNDGRNIDNLKFVGLEFETRFYPSHTHLRALMFFFKSRKINVSLSAASYYGTYRSILMGHIKDLFLPHIFKIVVKRAHEDGGGLEFVLQPMTLAAYKDHKSLFELFSEVLQLMGFKDLVGGDGMHCNVDFTMFSQSLENTPEVRNVRQQTLANVLWFAWYNPDFMVQLTNRVSSYGSYADLSAIVGDLMLQNEKRATDRFLVEKEELLTAISNGTTARLLELSLGRDGRACVEFRWFGSTLNTDHILSYIEFCYAITAFCVNKTSGQCTIERFSAFVENNIHNYGHLHTRLSDLRDFISTTIEVESSTTKVTIVR